LSGYILVMIVGIAVSGVAALWVRSSYSKYSKKMSASGLTGAQTARMILDRNNLTKVRVEPVAGQLTDHYDPMRKVVKLSEAALRLPPSHYGALTREDVPEKLRGGSLIWNTEYEPPPGLPSGDRLCR
jgi:Zn-dependent membrane protease YugP